jgi:hypothetical protein
MLHQFPCGNPGRNGLFGSIILQLSEIIRSSNQVEARIVRMHPGTCKVAPPGATKGQGQQRARDHAHHDQIAG